MIYLALLSLLGTGLAALAVDTFMDSDDQSTDPNDELIVNGPTNLTYWKPREAKLQMATPVTTALR